MKTVVQAAAVVMMSMLALRAPAACKLEQMASVKVEFDDKGAVLVPVKVNGQPAWMILGMGTGLSSVWRVPAEQLGLKLLGLSGETASTGGGVPITDKVVIDSLEVGRVRFSKWDFYVVPVAKSGSADVHGQPLLGSLTSRFMRGVDVELDLGHGKLNLFRQTSGCNGQQVYWGGEYAVSNLFVDSSGLLVFPMEVEGKPLETSFSTEGRFTYISEAVTHRFFGFDQDSPGVIKEDSPAGNQRASFRAMALTAKGLSVKNVKIRLVDDRKSDCDPRMRSRATRAIGFDLCSNGSPLAIGTDLLRKVRIYIATKESKIYFTRAEEPDSGAGDGPMAGDRGAAGAAAAGPAGDAAGAAPAAAAPGAPAPPTQ